MLKTFLFSPPFQLSIIVLTGRDTGEVDVHTHRPWSDAPPRAFARARTLSWTDSWTESRTWAIPRFRSQYDGAKSWTSKCLTPYAYDGVYRLPTGRHASDAQGKRLFSCSVLSSGDWTANIPDNFCFPCPPLPQFLLFLWGKLSLCLILNIIKNIPSEARFLLQMLH